MFSVRTNKSGVEHKLGHFYNLSVKFNGIMWFIFIKPFTSTLLFDIIYLTTQTI
jgi:hypothetical protein